MSGNRKGVMSPIERAEQDIADLERQSAISPVGENAPPVGHQQQTEVPFQAPAAQEPPAVPVWTPEPPQGQVAEPGVDYYQRWSSLKGILQSRDAQITQLMEQNNTLLQRLEAMILAQQAAPPAQAPQAPQGSLDEHIAGLITEYGDGMIQAMKRVSEHTFGGKFAEMEARLSRLDSVAQKVDRVEETQAESEARIFKADLKKLVPEYEAIMAHPTYQQWAPVTVEPYTGLTFSKLFEKANAEWNLQGMAGVFNAFKAAHAAPAAVPDPRLALITPDSSSSGTQFVPPQGQAKIWTAAEVDQFYRDVNRGKYSEEDYLRISREIDEANMRGLISP